MPGVIKRNTPLMVRSAVAAVLIICAGVVLGISSHVENSGRQFGFSSKTYTLAAFMGALVLVVEIGLLILRFAVASRSSSTGSSSTAHVDRGVVATLVSLRMELTLMVVLGVLWMASAICTTITSTEGRSLCRHLDDLFNEPEFEGLDQDALAVVRNVLQSACSEIHAELAFLWIGFVLYLGIGVYLAVLGLRQKARGIDNIWLLPISAYDHTAHSPVDDPFSDPVGVQPGPVAGVVDEDDIRKP